MPPAHGPRLHAFCERIKANGKTGVGRPRRHAPNFIHIAFAILASGKPSDAKFGLA